MVITDEKLLRQKSEPVSSIEEGISIGKKLIDEVQNHPGAVGLSAPQIGIFKRVFITLEKNGTYNEVSDWNIWLNPAIEELSVETCPFNEGCLSFPGITVSTNRPAQITAINGFSENDFGANERWVLYEMDAIVFQHELDHLNGVLFFDRRASVVKPFNRLETPSRNKLCPCGSGLKFKKCHGK